MRASWLATVALLGLAVALVVFAFYPGLGNPDTNQTIFQSQTNVILDWWTPFGSEVLRRWTQLGLGLNLVWLVQTTLFVFGAWLLLRHVLTAVWAAAATVLIVVWPPTYGQLAGLSRDVFFMGCALIALGALAAAYREAPERTRRRGLWLAVALIGAMVSYLSRENGVVVVIAVVLGALPLVAGPRIAGLRRRRRVIGAVLVAGLTGICAFAAGIVMDKVIGVRAVHAERMLYVYDLASMSELSGHDRFPATLIRHHRPGWVTPYVDQRTLDREFDFTTAITLYPHDLAGSFALTDTHIASQEAAMLRSAWLHAIADAPQDYLWTRLRLTAAQLGITHHATNAFLGEDDPTNYGRPLAFRGGIDTAGDWMRPFVGPTSSIPLDIQWPYLLLSILLTIYLWRRRRDDRPLLLAIAVIMWLNLVVDFFFAPAASYSYADLEIPLTMILALWAVWVAVRRAGEATGARGRARHRDR